MRYMSKNGKKILCGILSIMIIFVMVNENKGWKLEKNFAEIQTVEADESGFVIEDGVLTKYTGNGGDVEIPSGVKSIGDYAFMYCRELISVKIPNSVTSIGKYAFSNCENLKKIENLSKVTDIGMGAFRESGIINIELPSTLKKIEEQLFLGCTELTNINIPKEVTSIGIAAFDGCSNLQNIEIPAGITSIGFGAFADCAHLTEITLPENITDVGDRAFRNCISLVCINVSSANSNYCSVDGILFNKNRTELISYPSGRTEESYTIPQEVTTIYPYAFSDGNNLQKVEISSNVTNLKESTAFFGNSLKEINVTKKNKYYCSIDGVLFNKAKKALIRYPAGRTDEEYIIPDSIKTIVADAFNGSSLKSIKIPKDTTAIGFAAFAHCKNLIDIEIPDKVIDIADFMFLDCSSLMNIKIPDGVTNIGQSSFSGCSSLMNIKIPDGVTNIDEFSFSRCSSLTEVEIPVNVKSIGRYAFSYCWNLKSIKIPSNQTEIGEYAISNCMIYCPENSYAHIYAKKNGLEYTIIEAEDILTLKKKKIILKKGQKSKVKLFSKHNSVSYESKNTSIASVDSKGTVTGERKGKTVIVVRANGMTAKVKVTVKPSSANEVLLNKNMKLSKKAIFLKKGTKLAIQKASGVSGKVTFRSLNTKIATVSVKGIIKARKKGRTAILIKNNGKSIKLKVTIK